MDISVIGVGHIGSTMGRKWTAAGHSVTYGARDPQGESARALQKADPQARIVPVPNALAGAEVVLLALPYAAVSAFVRENAEVLAGKIIIDATNHFGGPIVNNVRTVLDVVPTALVFRAFNSLGWELFAHPNIGGTMIDHFYCGPDGEARQVVEGLIREIGVRPIWVGGYESVRIVDALGSLWATLVFQRGYGRDIALKLLER